METVGIVVSALTGLSVGAEKAFTNAIKHQVGRMFIINQMDREHASFDKVLQQLRDRHGSCVVPVLMPIGEGANFKGVVNVLKEKGYDPINQIVGYILSEDPTYITNYKSARTLICKIDRDELLQVLVRNYLGL